MKPCTIVFSGRRDNFEVAKALRDGGWDVTLVTDLLGRTALQRWPVAARAAERLSGGMEGFDGIHVHTVPDVFVEKMVRRLLRRGWSSVWSAERLGRAAAAVANRRGGLLVSYSTYAYEALNRVRPQLRRLLFQMHPHAQACVNLVESISGQKRGRDRNVEWEFRLSQNSYDRFCAEWRHADGILAASSFTKQTLIAVGASPERIAVVPYGSTDYGWRGAEESGDGVVRLLFVGSFVRRKGTLVLAEAVRRARSEKLEVHACGRGLAEPAVLRAFAEAGIVTHWNLPDEEVRRLRGRCDAFVFPSLLEGFGHVVLESMLQGQPVIATDRTCAPDIIVEGEHGWIVPAGEVAPLEQRVRWCSENKDRVRAMRRGVRARALEFDWPRFRCGVATAVEQLLRAR